MQLLIDDNLQSLIPIKTFRQEWQLPDNFGVAIFEPKDFTGLASIDRAGSELNQLRVALLDYTQTHPDELLIVVDTLQATFRAGLYGINERIGLKVVEMEYAISSFGDVLQNWAYALVMAKVQKREKPLFMTVYHDWLYSTVRTSTTEHLYPYHDDTWRIQIINHAYGRVGLRIQTANTIHFVYDGVYACPAEGYMQALLQDLASTMADF